MRWMGGLFLIAHGLVHMVFWVPPMPKDAPFDRCWSSPSRRGGRLALAIDAVIAVLAWQAM